MSRSIDYFFSVVSPWAFIGHAAFMAVAQRHGVAVRYHPVQLGGLFAQTGGLPLPKRHPARQHYRLVELQRWRAARGLDLHLHPAHWPFDGALADRLVLAAAAEGHDADPLVRRLTSGVWQRQEDMADPAQLAAVLAELGLPAVLLEAAGSEAVGALYEANRQRAVEADVFGSPAYVLDGEVFWGQDRIDLLDAALSSGRAPFTPEG
ncbi:2-hydroxychromene-2-carboxylate isomerase [Ancylobacter oerskovii]|uniref:2-hydroxychromene-2-carboxylate isomerase n=1 Tax=Ancylobacter oerskovii TaxID=459519 RepID=A0ABW4YX58_9HYPH|nr:2-hydroxychromene-2-carboxylate isomerase [Ancylobacter oerskovii]MBS7542283.1 2-hydroxychromene-2-carboxylate isomerase [Ancylobacter oerskovii]